MSERTCQTCIGYLKPRWDCTTCHGTGQGPSPDQVLADAIWADILVLVEEKNQRLFWGSQFCQGRPAEEKGQVQAALMALAESGKLDAYVSVYDYEGEQEWGSLLSEFDPTKWDEDITIEITFGLAESHEPKVMPKAVADPLIRDIRKALDRLYKSVDGLIQAGEFDKCNEMLRDTVVEDMDTYLLIGLLTITAIHTEQLPERVGLFQRVQRRLIEIAPERHEKLLSGLE